MIAVGLLIVAGLAAAGTPLADSRGADRVAQEEAPAKPGPEAPHWLSGEERTRFLVELGEKMGREKTIAATFEQEKKLALFKDPLRAGGVILFAAPDRLRWEFREPFRSILVVSGQTVAKFEREENGWRKVEQGRQAVAVLVVMDNIRAWFRGEFSEQEKAFEVRVAREPRPVIAMRPLEKALARNLKSIELRLAEALTHVEQVTLVERNGDRTVMSFSRLKREKDEPLPPGLFATDRVEEVSIERSGEK